MSKNNKELPETFEYPPTLFESDYIAEGFTEEEKRAERKRAYEDGQRVHKQMNRGVKLPEKQRLEAKRDKLMEDIERKTQELEITNSRLKQIYDSEAEQ